MAMPRVHIKVDGYHTNIEKIVFGGYNNNNQVLFNGESNDFESMASYIGEFFLIYENDNPKYKCKLLTIDTNESGKARLVYEIVSELKSIKISGVI